MRVLVTGATGFLGSYVLPLLKRYEVVVFARRPVKTFDAIYGDLRSTKDVEKANADVVVNLAGVLKGDFKGVHVNAVKNLVSVIPRIVHVSALWASPDGNEYQRTKWMGEIEAMKAKSYLIVRPSAMFGVGDKFVNRILGIMRKSPVIPYFHGSISPVFAGDVARIVCESVEKVVDGAKAITSVCGPRDFTIREIFQLIADVFGMKKPFVRVPHPVLNLYAKMGGNIFLSMFEERACKRLETDIEDYLRRNIHEFKSPVS